MEYDDLTQLLTFKELFSVGVNNNCLLLILNTTVDFVNTSI